MKRISIFFIAAFMLFSANAGAKAPLKPSATYKFVQRDTCGLFLDVYNPEAGAQTTFNGKEKPTIIYIFGGGFKNGRRDSRSLIPFYEDLTSNGYRVVAIDYRLGLKGVKNAGINIDFAKSVYRAVDIAVEDLYSATRFLLENKEMTGIDPDNLVICGSSAGAMTALQAEWELCNGTDAAGTLPENFSYKGVVAFSGAILSTIGSVKFPKEPCPIMLLHGTSDKIVFYNGLQFFNFCFAGSKMIAKALKKEGRNYNFLKFTERNHEIAGCMREELPEMLNFLENNVITGNRRIVEAEIDNQAIPTPEWAKKGFSSLY